MCSTSMLPCIMKMISNLTTFFIFQIFIFKIFLRFLNFHIIPTALLLITTFFLFNFFLFSVFIVCALKDSQNFFMQYLHLYISCLCLMLLNDDIVDIEKRDGICSLTFVVDEFLVLFLHPSIFSIIHSRSG